MSGIIPGISRVIDSLRSANGLFLLGVILFLGSLGGFAFKKLRIPQVVGYIIIGILIGQSGFRFLNVQLLSALEPISTLALALIGFLIGAELKIPTIKKYGRQFVGILLFESVTPFFIVSVVVALIYFLLARDLKTAVALGLTLGAISSATAPAATTDVLAENRAKGPLTTILIGIVAMDDAVGLILFAIASTFAGNLVGERAQPLQAQLLSIVYSIGASCALGSLFGLALSRLIKYVKNDDGRILAFSLGAILLLTGACAYLSLNTILAAMAMGFFIVNFSERSSVDLFDLVDQFTPPIYVMFFVLVGAKLNIWQVSAVFAFIALGYVVARTVGKSLGSSLGALITGAPRTVQKYMRWCLLSQAGVAIGLSIASEQLFPKTIGPMVMLVVTATTFIVQLLGPVCVKRGISLAGEVGLDINEEDILRDGSVSDVIKEVQPDSEAAYLREDATFDEIIAYFGRRSSLSCPVCCPDGTLSGIITIDNLKETLLLGEISEGILAFDLTVPAAASCRPDSSLAEVKRLFREKGVETLPVIDKDRKVKGIIEERMIEQHFQTKAAEIRERVESLERA